MTRQFHIQLREITAQTNRTVVVISKYEKNKANTSICYDSAWTNRKARTAVLFLEPHFSLSLQTLCEQCYAEVVSKYIQAAQALYRRGEVKFMNWYLRRSHWGGFITGRRLKTKRLVGKYILKMLCFVQEGTEKYVFLPLRVIHTESVIGVLYFADSWNRCTSIW